MNYVYLPRESVESDVSITLNVQLRGSCDIQVGWRLLQNKSSRHLKMDLAPSLDYKQGVAQWNS